MEESVEDKVALKYLYRVFEAMVQEIGFFEDNSSKNVLSSPTVLLERVRQELIESNILPAK